MTDPLVVPFGEPTQSTRVLTPTPALGEVAPHALQRPAGVTLLFDRAVEPREEEVFCGPAAAGDPTDGRRIPGRATPLAARAAFRIRETNRAGGLGGSFGLCFASHSPVWTGGRATPGEPQHPTAWARDRVQVRRAAARRPHPPRPPIDNYGRAARPAAFESASVLCQSKNPSYPVKSR